MTDVNQNTNHNDNLKLVYQELCNSYRAVDTFRTALLGFLPLASGSGIILLFTQSKGLVENDVLPLFVPIGFFGFLVTFGLFMFEIYGIRKCHNLILAGKKLESDMGVEGQFKTRADAFLGFINEPFAAGIIYPAVLAAWFFVFVYAVPKGDLSAAIVAALDVLIVGVAACLYYNYYLSRSKKAE